jgi:hypothetical protein
MVRFGTRRKPRAGADIPAGKHDHGTEEIERHRRFRIKFLTFEDPQEGREAPEHPHDKRDFLRIWIWRKSQRTTSHGS